MKKCKSAAWANVINLQRFSLNDGPGIRTTVFFKGCPLRCQWCANPETQSSRPQLQFSCNLCNQCGACMTRCAENAIQLEDGELTLLRDSCTVCGVCVDVCSQHALGIAGRNMTADEIVSSVLRDQVFFQEGGGVTCSGGEPLNHPEVLAEVATKLRAQGVHIILDTSGYAPEEVILSIAPLFDEIYFDVKHIDPDLHKVYTGVSNELILSNLKKVSALDIPVALRYPMIPGINDSEENLRAMARLAKSLIQYTFLYILPYHNYGKSKYEMLNIPYALPDIEPPKKKRIDEVKRLLSDEGVRIYQFSKDQVQ